MRLHDLLLPVVFLIVAATYASPARAQACNPPCFEYNGDCVCEVAPIANLAEFLKDGALAESYAGRIAQPSNQDEEWGEGICTWRGGTQLYSGQAPWDQPFQQAWFRVNPEGDYYRTVFGNDVTDAVCTSYHATNWQTASCVAEPSPRRVVYAPVLSAQTGTQTYEFGYVCTEAEGADCVDHAPAALSTDAVKIGCVVNTVKISDATTTLTQQCRSMVDAIPGTPPTWIDCRTNEKYCEVRYTKHHSGDMWLEKAEDACANTQTWDTSPACTCTCVTNAQTHAISCTCDPVVYSKNVSYWSPYHPAYQACVKKAECEANNGGLECQCAFSKPNSPWGTAAYTCP